MKKFILKISVLLLLIIVICTLIITFNFFVVSNQYQYIYTSSLLDKMERLKSINEPKIILTGNSNLAFGIKSELMEHNLNMKVVNLGLHGDFNNIFLENMAKENLNTGDIVVLSITNYSTNGLIKDYNLVWSTLEKHTDLYKLVDEKDYINMLKSLPKYINNSTGKWINNNGNKHPKGQYSRDAFNKYGDIEIRNEPKKQSTLFKEGKINVPKLSQEVIDNINEYNDYVKSKGAYLVITAYPIAYGEYTPDKSEYDKFEDELKKSVNCDVISHFHDYFIPYDYFLDTVLHLNDEGAKIRTITLINDMKKWMKDNYK